MSAGNRTDQSRYFGDDAEAEGHAYIMRLSAMAELKPDVLTHEEIRIVAAYVLGRARGHREAADARH